MVAHACDPSTQGLRHDYKLEGRMSCAVSKSIFKTQNTTLKERAIVSSLLKFKAINE